MSEAAAPVPGGPVTTIAVLADDRRAFSASEDRTLRLWDFEAAPNLRRVERRAEGVSAVTTVALCSQRLHFDAALTALAIDRKDRAVIGDAFGRLHWNRYPAFKSRLT